ncbi:MAG: hypothetical protein KatS3mg114_0956 [Planctomycetaceae bacterium]|nr:MAG: hypothetical protein KatS3mg114_0956 [Planctomycetaceae bacterium]
MTLSVVTNTPLFPYSRPPKTTSFGVAVTTLLAPRRYKDQVHCAPLDHFRWEWSPVVARCRALIAWLLLLTVLGQSVVPCGCAQCGLAGNSCDDECLDERGGPTACRHVHKNGAHDTGVSELAARRHSRGQDTPGPAPSESPCRKLAAFISTEGSSVRMAVGEVRDVGAFVPFAQDIDVHHGRCSALIVLDLGPFEPPRLARGVRLQV